jgi:hypothetical protein
VDVAQEHASPQLVCIPGEVWGYGCAVRHPSLYSAK